MEIFLGCVDWDWIGDKGYVWYDLNWTILQWSKGFFWLIYPLLHLHIGIGADFA
jgi:hypothetical protein